MARTRLTLPLALLVIVGGACGDSTSPDPMKPPPSPTAASVTVLAGDGQSVAAGEPVPVPPAVVVRDTKGNPFKGATVQFAVTEGGGTLEGATQVTDAAGTARVTRWTVGGTGVQRISATVGTLAPVTMEATLDPATVVIVEIVPPAGGTVGITTPGHPYEGLELTIPSGTFPTDVNWSIQLRPDATPPTLPVGYRVGGPLLEIITDAPRGDVLMTLDIPIQRQPDESAVVVLYDPARGVMEVLPTVMQSETLVRVVTTHLRADLLLGPPLPSASSGRFPQRMIGLGSSLGNLVTLLMDPGVLPPVPSVLDPVTEQWGVLDYGSADVPNGFGPTIPALTVMGSHKGSDLGSIVKGLMEPGHYQDAGILGAVQAATQSTGELLGGLQSLFAKYNEGSTPAERDANIGQNLIASLGLTGEPGFAAAFRKAFGPTDDGTWFVNPVASENDVLTLSMATDATDSPWARLASGFSSLNLKQTGDGPETTVDAALPMSSFTFAFEELSPFLSQIEQFDGLDFAERAELNGNLAELFEMQFPLFETESVPGTGFSPENGNTLPVRTDNLKVRLLGVPFDLEGLFKLFSEETGAEVANSDGSGVDLGPLVGPQDGAESTLILSTWKKIGDKIRQLSPQMLKIVRAGFSVSPEAADITPESTSVSFEADVPLPPESGFRVRWDWGDGTTSENLSLTNGSHTYDTPGDYTVTVTLLSADGKRVLGRYTVLVKNEASPHWLLTSIFDADTLGSAASVPITVLLADAVANPSSAMIAVEDGFLDSKSLLLRVLAGGTWTEENCCSSGVLGDPLPGETRGKLGEVPALTRSFGPIFNGFETTWWSESTTDLSSGTMEGQYVIGSFNNYWVFTGQGQLLAERQTGPELVLRFNATRNGTEMTGTITVIYWEIGDLLPGHSVQYVDTVPEYFRFPFTATRIR